MQMELLQQPITKLRSSLARDRGTRMRRPLEQPPGVRSMFQVLLLRVLDHPPSPLPFQCTMPLRLYCMAFPPLCSI